MIITNCPRCGAMNATTTCTKCGWSQFAQVTMVSTRITGEIEIMLSGKALLDDYKRLLLENRNLKERVAELEAEQRWRVVADGELPEFGTSILFYDSILEKINKGTCTALDRDKINLQWITDDGLYYHGNRCEYITHWMPLPELPEGA